MVAQPAVAQPAAAEAAAAQPAAAQPAKAADALQHERSLAALAADSVLSERLHDPVVLERLVAAGVLPESKVFAAVKQSDPEFCNLSSIQMLQGLKDTIDAEHADIMARLQATGRADLSALSDAEIEQCRSAGAALSGADPAHAQHGSQGAHHAPTAATAASVDQQDSNATSATSSTETWSALWPRAEQLHAYQRHLEAAIVEEESKLASLAKPIVRRGNGWQRVTFVLDAEHLAKSNVSKLRSELCDSVKLPPLLPHGSAGRPFYEVWALDPLHMLINTWRNVESWLVLAGFFWLQQGDDGSFHARTEADKRRLLKEKLAAVKKDLNTTEKAVACAVGPHLQSEIDTQASCKRPMMGHDGTDCAKVLAGHQQFLAEPGMAALCAALGTFEGDESLPHAWLRCLQTIMKAALERNPGPEPHREPGLVAAVQQLQRI